MAKQKEATVETIAPIGGPGPFEADNSRFEADNRALEGGDFEEVKPALQPLRRTITPSMTVGERGEPDTYDRAPVTAPPAPFQGKHDPAVPKTGYIQAPSSIHQSAQEAFLTDEEKWALVRPKETRRCFIGPRIWYFEKDVQLSVPESVKAVLARANMIHPG